MSDDYGAKANLLKSIDRLDQILSSYPDDEDTDLTEHYNRARLMLTNIEAKVHVIAEKDDEYQEKIQEAEENFSEYSDFQEKVDYLRQRLEALYELLSRKSIYQLRSEQKPGDADPL